MLLVSSKRICALFYPVHRRDNLDLEDRLVEVMYFCSIVRHVPMCDQTSHVKRSWGGFLLLFFFSFGGRGSLRFFGSFLGFVGLFCFLNLATSCFMSLFCVIVQVSLHLYDHVSCICGTAFNEHAL